MSSVIRSMLDINSEIDLKYRQSKLPIKIKKFIAKKQRKDLRKVIDELFEKDELSTTLFYEYYTQLKITYPAFGRYRHCAKTSSNPNMMVFIHQLENNDRMVAIATLAESVADPSQKVDISYSYIKEGKTAFRYSESSREEYPFFKKTQENPDNDMRINVRNQMIDIIREDMKLFIMEAVDRSSTIE